MNIIIPMAGRGTRLRPHTLTTPKPLIPVGGKPIVHRLVEDIVAVLDAKIDHIAFVVGGYGEMNEDELLKVASDLGAEGHIFYQPEALGTAHAVFCAKDVLKGPVVVAYADTLFRADFKIQPEDDGILWVKQIENPSAYGVIKTNEKGEIVDFVEKPKEFVSDLAMIGIYYFKEGKDLLTQIEYLIENDIVKGGEYQLPDALRRLTENGCKFKPGKVDEWLDCGNKKVTVQTNQRVLEFDREKNINLVHPSVKLINSVVIPPCYIGENVTIENSIVGPHVSIGDESKIVNAIVKNSILQKNVTLEEAVIQDSMIGNKASFKGKAQDLSLGDYSTIE